MRAHGMRFPITLPTDLAFAGLDTLSDLSERLVRWASPERAYVGELVRLFALKSGDRLLDVGCGSGDLLAAAAAREAGAVLLGIDPDEDALELASHKITGTIHAAELHQGVAEDLPFEDESFDIVSATRLLVSLDPRTRSLALRECWRVLRPGGRLLVADWEEEPKGIEAIVTYPWRLVRDTFLTSAVSAPTVAEAISIARFHPPEPRSRFRTAVGIIEILEAFKPLQT
jgi:ubiquinone/menaquinone biosynthesis C-methylase UbiE